MKGLINSDDDDAVKTLAEQGDEIRELPGQCAHFYGGADYSNLAIIVGARDVLSQIWPILSERSEIPGDLEPAADRLASTLASDVWADRLTQVATDAAQIRTVYDRMSSAVKDQHEQAFNQATDVIQRRDDFGPLSLEGKSRVLAGFEKRRLENRIGQPADLRQMEEDLRLLPTLISDALIELERLLQPETRIERVSISRFLRGAIGSTEELEDLLSDVRDHCSKLIGEGAKVLIE